jgi:hypothetical protein
MEWSKKADTGTKNEAREKRVGLSPKSHRRGAGSQHDDGKQPLRSIRHLVNCDRTGSAVPFSGNPGSPLWISRVEERVANQSAPPEQASTPTWKLGTRRLH